MAKKFKKVISAFLTLVLCISAMNLTVFAEEENTVQAHQKSHLLGAAENDLATFNFKVVEEYIPEARDSRLE